MRRTGIFFLYLTIAGCSGIIASPHADHRRPASRYPQRWWEMIPKDQAASWEILPQEAHPGEVILSKRNVLGTSLYELSAQIHCGLILEDIADHDRVLDDQIVVIRIG